MKKWAWIAIIVFLAVIAYLTYSENSGLLGAFNKATGVK